MCSCLITVIIRVRDVLRGIWVEAVDCRRFSGGSDIKEFGLPAMQETRVQSLGQEDSPGEGNGNPFQYSCLENSMDKRSLVGYSLWSHKELDMTE